MLIVQYNKNCLPPGQKSGKFPYSPFIMKDWGFLSSGFLSCEANPVHVQRPGCSVPPL